MTKTCNVCKKEKNVSLFYKRSDASKDLYKYCCKECDKINATAYTKTYDGKITRMLVEQKQRCVLRKHPQPAYTNDEFREWLSNLPLYNELYLKWVASGFNKWLSPSIDRLDNAKTYSFDNIRLVIWKDNHDEGNRTKRIGVTQYDLDMNEVQTFRGLRAAARSLNKTHPPIVACCKGEYKQAYGFIWRYSYDMD